MPKKALKILEICPFSAGICGVWSRVFSESQEFKKLGFEVRVFSSDIIKGTKNIAKSEEEIKEIQIKRFPASKSFFSDNVYNFNFKKEFKEYSPDIVITHLLHPHSVTALKLCRERNIPCYLVTHAPFNVKRKFPLNFLTYIYNKLKVSPKINKFTKIIAITKWEMPYLESLGVDKQRIFYIPNGLPEDFFIQKKSAEEKKVLFLGRIAPVKNIEYIIKAAEKFPEIRFSIVGSAEEEYLIKLRKITELKKLDNISFLSPVYNLLDKIKLIDSHQIFVLPSKREAMPQVILEAMARGKIIIASKTDGSQELIEHDKNGFIFPLEKEEDFFKLIRNNLNSNKEIRKNAERTSKKYSWQKLIKLYISLFNTKNK
jgi:glycosyltransferase involved in cell wall biosynthesis